MVKSLKKLWILKLTNVSLSFNPIDSERQNNFLDKTVNKSALLLAVEKRQLTVAKYLGAHTDLASKVDESGRNALHYLSGSTENVVDFLEALISRGAKAVVSFLVFKPCLRSTF